MQKNKKLISWHDKIATQMHKLLNNKIVYICYIIFFPIILTIFTAYVQYDHLGMKMASVIYWMFLYPLPFLINIAIASAIFLLIWVLTKRVFWATLVLGIIIWAFSAINYFKIAFRGEPFYPTDISILGEAIKISPNTSYEWPHSLVWFGITIILSLILAWHLTDRQISKKLRIIYGSGLLLVCLLSFPLYFTNQAVQSKLGSKTVAAVQTDGYLSNGLLNAFLMQYRYSFLGKPEGYSRLGAEKLISDTKIINKNSTNKPNIIVIMDESFWDPTKLPNVEYNIDPMEGFRALQTESTHGDLIVQPFGGQTANTEFEALTGFSASMLPVGSSAYQQYYNKPLPSLPLLLKSEGYSTVAIHPFAKTFWNRNNVYPNMGIDNFISWDGFKNSKLKGSFVSDDAVVDKIISDYEAAKKDVKPYFAHVVTMQNHGSYNPDRYGSSQEIHVKSSLLNSENRPILETYAQGVKDANSALVRITDYFRNKKDPTIIIFFGDHLPSFGDNYSVYRDTGYISKTGVSDEDYLKLHSVPFLIWNNTSQKNIDLGAMNSFYMAPTILGAAQMPMNEYLSYLYANKDKAKACLLAKCIQKDGGLAVSGGESYMDFVNSKQIMQYYYMFDKKYSQ